MKKRMPLTKCTLFNTRTWYKERFHLQFDSAGQALALYGNFIDVPALVLSTRSWYTRIGAIYQGIPSLRLEASTLDLLLYTICLGSHLLCQFSVRLLLLSNSQPAFCCHGWQNFHIRVLRCSSCRLCTSGIRSTLLTFCILESAAWLSEPDET